MEFDPSGLRYNADGLVPCIAQEEATGEVLMLAWMNAEAVARTLATGRVTYWSRSRAAFWVKGESNRRACFYTAIREGREVEIMVPEI